MLYMSDDRKRVFYTEQECCDYESLQKKGLEEERIKKEKLEMERKDRLNVINKKYEELQNLLFEYEKDYGVRQRPYVAPFYEILDMLCG